MHFHSTRGDFNTDVAGAIMAGLAPDGGLLIPEQLPRLDLASLDGLSTPAELGPAILAPFFEGSSLAAQLSDICEEALDFPMPVRPVAGGEGLFVLELFHGPTAAFKDVGARFLAACMERILASEPADPRGPLVILVATSGDTGGAVAAAFHRRQGIRVVVLFPQGQVSKRQQHQLTCWGDNVLSLAVEGSFDACQAMVKAAFTDASLSAQVRLSSANSINVGRLMPQTLYYASAALAHFRDTGRPPNFIVPTGNLGNALACNWAKAMGLPIGEIVLATNANRTIPDYLATGDWQPRPSVNTLASAMDVGDPSNMERLMALYAQFDQLRDAVSAYPVEDHEIIAQIKADFGAHGQIWCPHTATAAWTYGHLPPAQRQDDWILVATAHAAKFEATVEPAIGTTIPIPVALQAILELPVEFQTIPAEFAELAKKILKTVR
jgi:threonine synthase